MAITSKNNPLRRRQYGNTQYRYAAVYIIVTFAVLLFLNIYTSGTSQELFYQSKQTSMIEKCLLISSKISTLDIVNPSSTASAISELGNLRVSRLVITDPNSIVIYDSLNGEAAETSYALFPEIVKALEGFDVFSWHYHDGAMQSRAATPIIAYDTLIGCVYMTEYDTAQGALIQSLQSNILSVTLILELVIILFSIVFSNTFSRRLRRIFASMRIIREGDYSHKVTMGGRDELTYLGDEFNDLTEKLQSSEHMRRQFVSDASHELKTPLASIKLLSDSILQNDMDPATVREFVEDIGNEADRLNRMTQKLLSLTRMESQQEVECEIMYIAPTVERVVRMLSAIAENNQITITLDLQQDSPILMVADDLYQIVFNLVENGIKYNTPGGSLSISLLREDDNAILRFSDTGVGIPQDSIGHIFERFYRVDKARSRKTGGSGLGLSIVRSMVERNGGQIGVQSVVGEGSVFTLTFPTFDTEEDLL